VVRATPLGNRSRALGPLFLSLRARQTFGEYARGQLHRMDQHRRWLRDPPEAPPRRADCGLPEHGLVPPEQRAAAEEAVKEVMARWQLDLEGLSPHQSIALQARIAGYLADVAIGTGFGGGARHRGCALRSGRAPGRHRRRPAGSTAARAAGQGRHQRVDPVPGLAAHAESAPRCARASVRHGHQARHASLPPDADLPRSGCGRRFACLAIRSRGVGVRRSSDHCDTRSRMELSGRKGGQDLTWDAAPSALPRHASGANPGCEALGTMEPRP